MPILTMNWITHHLERQANIEKHQFVCDKDLRCPGWKEGMKQLIATQIFCNNHTATPKYTGQKFKFCPWCGKEIIK